MTLLAVFGVCVAVVATLLMAWGLWRLGAWLEAPRPDDEDYPGGGH